MKSFGVISEIPSIRLYDYAATCGAFNIDLPTKYVIPEDRRPMVRDQGNVGACVAFSLAEILEVFNYIETSRKEQFSAGFIYGRHRDKDSKTVGMRVINALDHLTKIGSTKTSVFDELYEQPEAYEIIQSKASELDKYAEPYRIKGYASLINADKSLQDKKIKTALFTTNYPVVAVSNKYFGEKHCIILIGWDDEKDSYVFQNSWGKDYGDGGISSIPKNKINECYLLSDEVFELNFNDVSKNDWFYDGVKQVVLDGIMNGTSDTTFEPNRPITRAEFAVAIDRLCKRIDERFAYINERLNEL